MKTAPRDISRYLYQEHPDIATTLEPAFARYSTQEVMAYIAWLRKEKEEQHQQDVLGWAMSQQLKFEMDRVGTDGSLWEVNDTQKMLERIIDETLEALDVIDEPELLKMEVVDVLLFVVSSLNHLGLDLAEVMRLCADKIEHNKRKYDASYFEKRTVEEAIIYSREQYDREMDSNSERVGNSRPS